MVEEQSWSARLRSATLNAAAQASNAAAQASAALTASEKPASVGEVVKLRDDVEVTLTMGRAVAGQPYYNVRCTANRRLPVVVSHTAAPFRELRSALRASGCDELVRAPFPEQRFLRKVSEADVSAKLDVWCKEVVQLAQWGCLPPAVVARLAELIHFDTTSGADMKVEPERFKPRASTAVSKRRSQSAIPFKLPTEVDEEAAGRRIAELEMVVRMLKTKLSSLEIVEDNSSLEELEEELRSAAKKLLSGDASVEDELERIDAAIRKHPEYAEKIAAAKAEWERSEAPACALALERTRRLVPRDVHSSTARRVQGAFAAAAKYAGITEEKKLRGFSNAAKRAWSTQALWLVWLSEERLRKLHPADLRSRFAIANLDIVELRAVYGVLPKSFDNDPQGLKMAWRDQVRNKLAELSELERLGTLSKSQARHASYAELLDDLDVNDFLLEAPIVPDEPVSPASPEDPPENPPITRRATTGSLVAALERSRLSEANSPPQKRHSVAAVRPPPPNLLAQIQRRQSVTTPGN